MARAVPRSMRSSGLDVVDVVLGLGFRGLAELVELGQASHQLLLEVVPFRTLGAGDRFPLVFYTPMTTVTRV